MIEHTVVESRQAVTDTQHETQNTQGYEPEDILSVGHQNPKDKKENNNSASIIGPSGSRPPIGTRVIDQLVGNLCVTGLSMFHECLVGAAFLINGVRTTVELRDQQSHRFPESVLIIKRIIPWQPFLRPGRAFRLQFRCAAE